MAHNCIIYLQMKSVKWLVKVMIITFFNVLMVRLEIDPTRPHPFPDRFSAAGFQMDPTAGC